MLGQEELGTEVICVLGILWLHRIVVASGMKVCKNTGLIIQFVSGSQETLQAEVNEVSLALQRLSLQRPASPSAVKLHLMKCWEYLQIWFYIDLLLEIWCQRITTGLCVIRFWRVYVCHKDHNLQGPIHTCMCTISRKSALTLTEMKSCGSVFV